MRKMTMIKHLARRAWPWGGNRVKRSGDAVVCHFPGSAAGRVEVFPSPLKARVPSASFYVRAAESTHELVMNDSGSERVLATFPSLDDARDALRTVFKCLGQRPWRWVVRMLYLMAVFAFLVLLGQFMSAPASRTQGEIPPAAMDQAPGAGGAYPPQAVSPEVPAPQQGGLSDFGLQQ